MIRRLIRIGLTALLTTTAASVPHLVAAQEEQVAVAAQDEQATVIAIEEPEGGTPQDWAYTPAEFTVAVGQTVTWINTGAAPHTITTDDGVSFDSGNLDSQATFSITPDAPGTFTYHCSYHPWMTATLTVAP